MQNIRCLFLIVFNFHDAYAHLLKDSYAYVNGHLVILNNC